jgi:hypothetical protein
MSRLHSFKDSKGGCYANIRLDNGDPVFISVAQSGVVVKRSKLGFFGPQLYQSRTLYDAGATAHALHVLFPDYAGPDEISNAALRSFTNAVLHCSTTAEVANVLNTAVDGKTHDPDGLKPQDALQQDDLLAAADAIIRVYGDLLVRVSDEDKAKYPAGVYPESLLPIPKLALSQLLTIKIESTPDGNEKRVLETGFALLDGFVDDQQANEQNVLMRAALDITEADDSTG